MKQPPENSPLAPPRPKPSDECESAKILINEGLVEEAKKLLFRLLANHPTYAPAKKLLTQIEEIELKEIFQPSGASSSARAGAKVKPEDVNQLIQSLDRDLGLKLEEPESKNVFKSVNGLTPQEYLDLAIAYLEMECYADALRELQKAEKRIRLENTFLGDTGLVVVSLIARCMLHLGNAFDAKAYLQPILLESDIKHEDKILLYYEMGCIEQSLGNRKEATDWFQNVMKMDPYFKDTGYRLKVLLQKP